jgi:hypothetical protein
MNSLFNYNIKRENKNITIIYKMFNCPLCSFRLEIIDVILALELVKEHLKIYHPKPKEISK